jgi:hypothetical protein
MISLIGSLGAFTACYLAINPEVGSEYKELFIKGVIVDTFVGAMLGAIKEYTKKSTTVSNMRLKNELGSLSPMDIQRQNEIFETIEIRKRGNELNRETEERNLGQRITAFFTQPFTHALNKTAFNNLVEGGMQGMYFATLKDFILLMLNTGINIKAIPETTNFLTYHISTIVVAASSLGFYRKHNANTDEIDKLWEGLEDFVAQPDSV